MLPDALIPSEHFELLRKKIYVFTSQLTSPPSQSLFTPFPVTVTKDWTLSFFPLFFLRWNGGLCCQLDRTWRPLGDEPCRIPGRDYFDYLTL